ncbi:ABC transporter ATP-binding protein [Parcubacteria bacterium DG_74_2]|nr:MAG: ABC transporter ATP-binding protein [Parcubacteria bacterium DG_74_2]
MLAIEVKNLTKDFNGLKAIDNISFEVKEGEIFGLLGPNGAGKTTTIKILSTLLKPTEGEALVCSFNVLKEKDEVRNCIGIVFQEPALDNQLTAIENLDFHSRLYGLNKEKRQKRIKEVLRLVDLESKANILVKNYSGGMQRRLEIARGLMHYPRVLFLDESTLGLDPQTRRNIWDYILELNKREKITIILTTHYMEEADYLCEKVAIIDFGKIVALDTPQKLKDILGGDIISVEVISPERAFEVFKKISWVKKISKHNDIVNLNVEKGEKKIPLLIKIDQKEEGFEIKSVNLRKPTLEDVFLYFTGRTIREREVSRAEGNRFMMKRRFRR